MKTKIFALALIGLYLFSCRNVPQSTFRNKPKNSLLEGKYGLEGVELNDSLAIIGGFGSDIFPHPQMEDAFYLLTDRGPNYDYKTPDGSEAKGFSMPDYTPQIGLFKKSGDTYSLIKTIYLKNQEGKTLTGLPNLPGQGGTNEAAYSPDGTLIASDPEGIDPEGLVAAANGDFWVSDEYGPYLMRFDSTGVMLEKHSPFGDKPSLPRVFAKRRPNRGMEGLTLTPDGQTLVGIMQSSLYNPNKSVKKTSSICRILTFDIETSQSRQYAFVQERPGLSNSAICALDNQQFLVIERDSDYPAGLAGSLGEITSSISQYKMVVEIDLRGATDISDPENGANGLILEGKTIEQIGRANALAKHGIIPVKKRKLIDLLDPELAYVHDKAEGLAYLPSQKRLAIVNDNDFGIDSKKSKRIRKLNRDGELERTEIYFLKLK